MTFVPFYTLVNKTKESVFICEDGLDNWTEAQPEEVIDKPVNFCICNTSLCFSNVTSLRILINDITEDSLLC